MILGISGRKQSGKSTAANIIYGMYLVSFGICDKVRITDEGKLEVSDLNGDTSYAGLFDPITADKNNWMIERVLKAVDPVLKVYSFADPLKKSVCMDILGLSHESCYGTDEQKNTLTHLQWENMPGVVCIEDHEWTTIFDSNHNDRTIDYACSVLNVTYHKPGFMTGREVMEFVGTSVFRRIYSDVWVNATINQIKRDNTKLAIICDCRFPNEVDAIKQASGKVVRLTRDPFNSSFSSESALDVDKYDWANFDFVIDNKNSDIIHQGGEIKRILENLI
jgi:hypothetical protein